MVEDTSLKILIIKLSAFGDVIQTIPSLTLLKNFLPWAEIHWAIDKRNLPLIENHPFIKKVLPFSNAYFKNPILFWNFRKELAKERYFALLDYQGLFKSGIITFFAKAKWKAGFKNPREPVSFFYNFKYKISFENHAVKRYLYLTKTFLEEILRIPVKEKDLEKALKESFLPVKTFQEKKFNLIFPYVVIIPEARWESKLWPLFYWESLIESILKEYPFLTVYLLGSHYNRVLKDWSLRMQERFKNKVFSLVGETALEEVPFIIKRAKAVITVDTGPMHLASLLEVPTVALFGPTDPLRTGPWKGNFKVIRSGLSCSPCFKKRCVFKEGAALCLEKILPQEVFLTLKSLLNG